ncbi:hypothetical protein EJB05_44441 [Eragrostis curvula]|uniref:B box-type domain-containing protein n=1 Tax=Eragrostis curvula TaxID=38414 RepID=A0A5J9TI38_9POAL|nr:hypothetical protein EJB05_44441 [Eragrostis curvula]
MAPSWLELLLVTQFFSTCPNHLRSSRNECNLFCTDCEEQTVAFCYYCKSRHHSTHRVIQIRRSSYHDVVRVSEVEDILDISNVQTYVINGAKVVFLNERPQVRGCGASIGKTLSSSSHKCETCWRALLDEFRFCSLDCNLRGMRKDTEMPNLCDNGPNDQEKVEDVICSGNTSSNAKSKKESLGDNNQEEPPAKRVARRHRRKGIPQRAPFF